MGEKIVLTFAFDQLLQFMRNNMGFIWWNKYVFGKQDYGVCFGFTNQNTGNTIQLPCIFDNDARLSDEFRDSDHSTWYSFIREEAMFRLDLLKYELDRNYNVELIVNYD